MNMEVKILGLVWHKKARGFDREILEKPRDSCM